MSNPNTSKVVYFKILQIKYECFKLSLKLWEEEPWIMIDSILRIIFVLVIRSYMQRL